MRFFFILFVSFFQINAFAQNDSMTHFFNTDKAEKGFIYNCYTRLPDTAYLFSRIPATAKDKAQQRFLRTLLASKETLALQAITNGTGTNLISTLTGDTIGKLMMQKKEEISLTLASGATEYYKRQLPDSQLSGYVALAAEILNEVNFYATNDSPVKDKLINLKTAAGMYSLRDGGVDSGPSQFILQADSSFDIIGLGTYIHGNIRISPNGRLVCTEALPKTPFTVVGSYSDTLPAGKKIIECYGLNSADGLIGFSSSVELGDSLRKVFNDGANCIESEYQITVPAGMPYLQLACPELDRFHPALTPTFKGHAAVLPLTDKYNIFKVHHNERAAAASPAVFVIRQKENKLFLEDKELGIRKPVEKEVKSFLAFFKRSAEVQEKGGPFIKDNGQQTGYFIRPVITAHRMVKLGAAPPYFTANCPEE